MKKYVLSIIVFAFIYALPCHDLQGQDGALVEAAENEEGPKFTIVSKAHWNWNNQEGTAERWLEIEKDYHEKVTMKNEFIVGTEVYNHYFTEDNSEVLFISQYNSWVDIQKANDRTNELIEAAWPDSVEREKAAKERNSYYAKSHSDEIYSTTPYYKEFVESDEPMIRYIRVNKLAFPEDGKVSEIRALEKEFHEAVTYKNEYIKGFAAGRHAWGADGQDWVTVYSLESLADIEKMFDRSEELIETAWPDEEERKAFMKKRNKYLTPQHADYLYQDVPELRK